MLRRNMTSAECQISDPKGRYLVFTLLFFQMPMMKTQGLNTKIITKKPKSARNCESRAKCADCGASICSDCCVECCGSSFCGQCYDYHVTHSCARKPVQNERHTFPSGGYWFLTRPAYQYPFA